MAPKKAPRGGLGLSEEGTNNALIGGISPRKKARRAARIEGLATMRERTIMTSFLKERRWEV